MRRCTRQSGLTRLDISELVGQYYKFWDALSYNVSKEKEFTRMCDALLAKRRKIKSLFDELRTLKRDSPATEALIQFYHAQVICYPAQLREDSDLARVD